MSQINFEQNLSIRPTLAGLEAMYEREFVTLSRVTGATSTDDKRIRHLLMTRSGPSNTVAEDAQLLFTGRRKPKDPICVPATADDGICIFMKSLCHMSAEPFQMCSVCVVPGRIEWNKRLYDEIRDLPQSDVTNPWSCKNAGRITNYDRLSDSSTKDLKVRLVVDEDTMLSHRISAV